MKEIHKKRLQNNFTWTPADERLDNIGQPVPPRPVDKRKPKLWLTNAIKNNDETLEAYDIFLVNSSGMSLKSVTVDSGGWDYDADELIESSQKDKIEYKNINDGEAIKVFIYHPLYDGDETTWLSLKIEMVNDIIDFSTSYNQNTKRVDKEVVI